MLSPRREPIVFFEQRILRRASYIFVRSFLIKSKNAKEIIIWFPHSRHITNAVLFVLSTNYEFQFQVPTMFQLFQSNRLSNSRARSGKSKVVSQSVTQLCSKPRVNTTGQKHKTEWPIVCAYVHIGAQLKVKWRIEIFLCAFLKLDKNPLKMLLFLLNLKIQVFNFY